MNRIVILSNSSCIATLHDFSQEFIFKRRGFLESILQFWLICRIQFAAYDIASRIGAKHVTENSIAPNAECRKGAGKTWVRPQLESWRCWIVMVIDRRCKAWHQLYRWLCIRLCTETNSAARGQKHTLIDILKKRRAQKDLVNCTIAT